MTNLLLHETQDQDEEWGRIDMLGKANLCACTLYIYT